MAGFTIRFLSGKYEGGEFRLEPNSEFTIGREPGVDMVLFEDGVSREHAKLITRGDQVRLEDLGSTNGTFVNGERIQAAELSMGDRVLIGGSIFKIYQN